MVKKRKKKIVTEQKNRRLATHPFPSHASSPSPLLGLSSRTQRLVSDEIRLLAAKTTTHTSTFTTKRRKNKHSTTSRIFLDEGRTADHDFLGDSSHRDIPKKLTQKERDDVIQNHINRAQGIQGKRREEKCNAMFALLWPVWQLLLFFF